MIEMALRAAGLKYEVVRASAWEPDSAWKRLTKINPLGQIPTLVLQDGTVLTESVAILLFLALAYPEAELLPTTSSERAAALRGLAFIAANCYPAVSISDYPARWTTSPSSSAQEGVRQAARMQLHRSWEIFADTVGRTEVLNTRNPGALAFMAVVVSQWSGTRAHLASARPRLSRILLKLERHPRLLAVLSEHGDA
jgi:GST-like protein